MSHAVDPAKGSSGVGNSAKVTSPEADKMGQASRTVQDAGMRALADFIASTNIPQPMKGPRTETKKPVKTNNKEELRALAEFIASTNIPAPYKNDV